MTTILPVKLPVDPGEPFINSLGVSLLRPVEELSHHLFGYFGVI